MYSIKERVRYSETDKSGHLTLTGIVNYFQDCSTFQSEDLGVGMEFLKEHHHGWILSAWQVVVERYPKLCEEIEVSTWPTAFNGLYGTRNFVMKDKDNKCVAYANSIWQIEVSNTLRKELQEVDNRYQCVIHVEKSYGGM